ncbi:2-keto-4-pentenoate hydratase/2-oxohepta-3-ene-1,7-dioic acid hydratase in catechol pathway [Tamaricihabitans halophyticus]|uniref:2-keto-4-pentenoate hydratase/2-oxohepta-3-ene-1,7-dioic acid hydratase in catechol pathway n=1 Tax=Tamaricihabitans halophyticus TaxID=1262583 RepID=A0A4R2R626_9PSEU|nr:fumarylacetoacetate hydrolase family protein [Tamaricihabitans halophyticus]TCP55031.1 2-keto-4-pentenoate hydratase/2-oxohepta-3-ene-1,7-dioic acid hydratase in catechol pathway [Tamaricihabitans halophyticus]
MRWVTYLSPETGEQCPGLLNGTQVRGLGPRESLLDLLESEGGLDAAAERAEQAPVEVAELGNITLCAPIPRPPSIRDFLSFEEHLRNARQALGRPEIPPLWFEQPVFYFTNPAAVHGPDETIAISPGSRSFDYEVEVAAVIGRAGGNLAPGEAEAHIAGYTVFCDWSARDVQAHESTIGLGPAKGKDSATSIGPVLVTPDELEPYRKGNGYQLAMRASVNGQDYGGGSWADIYWSFGEMLAYASRGTTLVPGDVIGSGTVGTGCILELSGLHGGERYPYLLPGDTVRVEIAELGAITGHIAPSAPLIPIR